MLILGMRPQEGRVFIKVPPSPDYQCIEVCITKNGGYWTHVGFQADKSIEIRGETAKTWKEQPQ